MVATIRTIDELRWAKENDPALLEELSQQVTIDEDLRRYLKWLHDNEVTTTVMTKLRRYRRRSTGIHPSSASKKKVCLLKLYLECTFKIEPMPSYNQEMQATWDIGTLLHDTHQTHFRAMYGEQFEDEVPLRDDDLHIVSHTDGIFDFTRLRIVLEAKSIKEGGNYGWETVQQKPMEDHVRQAHFYMKLSDVPFSIIFYMNKNKGLYLEHAIMFDDELWDEIQNEVVLPVVAAAYEGGDPVQPTPGWHCKWCDFLHGCEAGKAGKDGKAQRSLTRRW